MTSDELPWTGLFDLFRVGIGPSSSHAVVPMISTAWFVSKLPAGFAMTRLRVERHGLPARTGTDHATDSAVVFRRLGERPDGVDADQVPALL